MTRVPYIRTFSSAVLLVSAMVAACSTPASAVRDVDIKTRDGVVLKGTLFAAAKPGNAILMLHQCDEQRKVWDSLGVRLMKAGITALSVDYRGYGESGGTPHDKLSNVEFNKVSAEIWPGDIDSAFAFLLRQPSADSTHVGVAGGSCGVNNALQLAEHHRNIRAVALLAGGTDQAGRHYLSAAGAPPVLVVAAADDQYANFVDIMGWLFALSPSKESRSVRYENGGHAAIVMRKHPELADTIARWFTAVLHDHPNELPSTNGVAMKTDVVNVLNEIDEPGGAERVTSKLAEARTHDKKAQLFPEYYANQLGYKHMQTGDMQGAIAIMKLNSIAYADSPNTMDSLGDVYLAAGDKKDALETARRTLLLLDTDTVDTAERKKNLRAAAEGKIKQLAPS